MMDEKQAPVFQVGQIVIYRGIVLRVTMLRDDGLIEARHPTLHVTGTPDEFKPA